MFRPPAALCAALLVAGCGPSAPAPTPESAHPHAEDSITLSPEQIAAAGIALTQPAAGGANAAIEAPALLESDPQATRVIAAPVAGRIVALSGNLGDRVAKGATLAVIESREAAALHGEVERARARADLARATLTRDETLYAKGFRPLREVEISRAAAIEANVTLRQARRQVSATGVQGASLDRVAITAPIAGQIIARSVVLGQIFMADAADTELYRIADLDRLSVSLSLPPAEAARIRPGMPAEVTADTRRQQALVRFVSPVLDEKTRLVRVLADLDNRAGQWRAGEPVQARIRTAADASSGRPLMIPAAAVQTVANRPVVFMRTRNGFRVVPVTLGRRDGARIAVTAGLSGGERIAAANSFVLKAELGKGEAGHED